MIEINNLTKQRVNISSIKRFFARVIKTLKIKKSVSLVFVSSSTIRKLNKKYRCKNQATDILSFADIDHYLGEIIISLSQAKKQANQAKHSLDKEVKILLLHGLLHLLGYDHHQKKKQEKMVRKEKQILKIIKT